jgi:antitoxin VapB
MPALTLRDVPEDLQRWIKNQASAHHRSVNKEVIALLDELRTGGGTPRQRPAPEHILALGKRCAALPELDARSAEAILGYDDNGLPD